MLNTHRNTLLFGAKGYVPQKSGFESLTPKGVTNRPIPNSRGPLYQNEVKCSAFQVEMIFHSHANY